ncbi:mannose-6-phosphate isomerase, type 1 [Raineyella antarctica]|uniref:mannose-6-phosphate isomerase n=1 Tax=Raineyella antarctica TaxID=1577474 RepID=A0A1G6GGK4_9ACTN|nr:mannose-6-phosphate isomerase, class I [Raineyella antarctica]SDB80306.1 mannose-6-phosphate isomerase, type 1 [Raineyella antarctica]
MKHLTGVVKDYAWGSPTAIPQILGTAANGSPQAEYWLGAHPLAPSRADGLALDALIADRPELLGAECRERFGGRLPFLMKILAAERQLSLQAHPSRAQAEAGFAEEDAAGIPRDHPMRTYRDNWPKPELLCALGPFEALYGFRAPGESFALFEQLDLVEVTTMVAPLHRPEDAAEAIRSVCVSFLHLPHGGLVDAVVAVAGTYVDAAGPLGLFARTAVQLAEQCPGDPGILVALLMNRTTLQRFEALYVPAGLLHAYLHGTGIEVMATSDNVVRGGLTAKHVDVDALASVVDFRPHEPLLVRHEEVAPGLWHYDTPAPEFGVWRTDGLTGPVELPATGRARIVLAVEGSLRIDTDQGPVDLPQGGAILFAAHERATIDGTGTAFIAAPGV